MDSHVAVDALAVSVPFLPVTVLAWLVSAEPAIRILGVFPPVAALLQILLKPKAKLEIVSVEEIKVEKDGNRGFRVKASARSKGRPIVSNVEAKLQFDPPVNEYYIAVTEVDDKRTTKTRTTWGPLNDSSTLGQASKLRQGDHFEFERPHDEIIEGSSQDPQGKTLRTSYYQFFAYSGTTPCRVRVLVQGDGPDGNTVSAKKDIQVIGAPNPV